MATDTAFGAIHADTLRALATADKALASAELQINDIHTVDAMTTEWFENVLAASTPGAKLLDMTPTEKHDGMTNRMAVTLRWNDAGVDGGLPAAVFVKATPERAEHRMTMSLMHMGELESNFYTIAQPELRDIAPRCYYARSYSGGRFAIVLEDLKQRDLRPYWIAHDCETSHAFAVATAQAQFHAKYWESERFNTDLVWVRPRKSRFGHDWVERAHRITRDHFLANPSIHFPEEHSDLLRLWSENSDTVYRYWDARPATLLHGDSHLGNTFSYPDGRAGYFDWQLIYRGPSFRDLAYFLMSALTNEQRVASENSIVEHYMDELERNGVILDREAGWKDYRLALIDAWDASLITLHHGTYGHAESGLHRQLETINGALTDHDVYGLLQSLLQSLQSD